MYVYVPFLKKNTKKHRMYVQTHEKKILKHKHDWKKTTGHDVIERANEGNKMHI